MFLTSTEVKAILNLSTATTTYDTLIDDYTKLVWTDIVEYTGNKFLSVANGDYAYISSDGMVMSTSKTFTLDSETTQAWTHEILAGDTIYITGTKWNDGFYTCSTRTSSIMTVSESVVTENSTDWSMECYVYRCDIPDYVKRIGAKMIWFNIQNTTSVQGNITSESYGGYSRSYQAAGNAGSFGLYPASLLSGLKRVLKQW